jgi:hypothetical protein
MRLLIARVLLAAALKVMPVELRRHLQRAVRDGLAIADARVEIILTCGPQ